MFMLSLPAKPVKKYFSTTSKYSLVMTEPL